MIILMRFVDKRFDTEITDLYKKFFVSLFKMSVSREFKGFNKVLNSFKILEIEPEVWVAGLATVTLAYD
jgi:hypothetical protein